LNWHVWWKPTIFIRTFMASSPSIATTKACFHNSNHNRTRSSINSNNNCPCRGQWQQSKQQQLQGGDVTTTGSSTSLYTDWAQGDVVCRNCGMVWDESMRDETSEWNVYQDTDASTRDYLQRTAGPVRPDGTLEPTSLSLQCYGGGGTSSNNTTFLRKRLIRIQHLRDHMVAKQQNQLVQSVSMDIAIRKRKLTELMMMEQKRRGGTRPLHYATERQNEEDEDETTDDETTMPTADDGTTTTSNTIDVPPPRNIVLIEEHLEAQLEFEQAQLDEQKRQLNIEKWTLRESASNCNDDNRHEEMEEEANDNGQIKDRERKKRRTTNKTGTAEFQRSQETLTKAAEIVRSLAQNKQHHHHGLSNSMVEMVLQRFQWYGATNDTLSNAACAAILQLACGTACWEAFGTTKQTVRKMCKQIATQFPNWISSHTAATATLSSTTTTATTETVIAVLDRLMQTATTATLSSNNTMDSATTAATTIRNATLALRDSLTTPATILAAVYFCSMVQYKLSQLGLISSGGTTSTPPSVTHLAKQTAIPASRIRAAYQNANRNRWLDQVATVVPQAVMVRKVLPNKAM
jgi:transcription initiation factor TFIIIB Brf1 subunit/transcription initiation factor TFIIB